MASDNTHTGKMMKERCAKMSRISQIFLAAAVLLAMAACDRTLKSPSPPVIPAVPPGKPYALAYDFEDGRVPEIKPLAANGKFTVNFLGITDEKAFRGGKSFKFQVTIESGTYFTWVIPFKVSAEDRLKLSCRYQMDSTGKGTFGPGVVLRYPAIASADGADFFDWASSTGGGWTELSVDLKAFAKNRITNRGWEIQPSQVGAEVEGMVICFRGTVPGERITLYIDELVVEGETRELPEEFSRRTMEQWLPVKAKHLAAIEKMQEAIRYDTQFLAACANPSQAAALLQQAARTRLTAWSAIAQAAAKRGYLLNEEVAAAGDHQETIHNLMANVSMLDGYDFSK